MNKHLIKIIINYIDYKLVFTDELIHTTKSVKEVINQCVFMTNIIFAKL